MPSAWRNEHIDLRVLAPLCLLLLVSGESGCQSKRAALQEFCSARETIPADYSPSSWTRLMAWQAECVTNEEMWSAIRALDDPDGHQRIRNFEALLDLHGIEDCAALLDMREQQAWRDAQPPHDDSYMHEAFRRDP